MTESSNNENRAFSTILKGLGMAAALLLPFACGFVSYPDSHGVMIRRGYNNHPGKKVKGTHVFDEHFEEILYDPAVHGEVENFVAEGETVANYPTPPGTKHVHRHPDNKEGIPVVLYGPSLELTIEKV